MQDQDHAPDMYMHHVEVNTATAGMNPHRAPCLVQSIYFDYACVHTDIASELTKTLLGPHRRFAFNVCIPLCTTKLEFRLSLHCPGKELGALTSAYEGSLQTIIWW